MIVINFENDVPFWFICIILKVGSCNVKCAAFIANGGIDEWYEIQYQGKRAGLLHIKTKWHPTGGHPHMQQQQPMMMQQQH